VTLGARKISLKSVSSNEESKELAGMLKSMQEPVTTIKGWSETRDSKESNPITIGPEARLSKETGTMTITPARTSKETVTISIVDSAIKIMNQRSSMDEIESGTHTNI